MCKGSLFEAASLEILQEMGEWAALGFYEAEQYELPWPRNYGRAYRRLYENMEVAVPADRCLIPCEPFYRSRNMETDGYPHPCGLILDFHKSVGLKVNLPIAKKKKVEYPQYARFIAEMCEDLKKKLVHFGGYTHSNPDFRRIVDQGFFVMEEELDNELSLVQSDLDATHLEEYNLLQALKEYTLGIKAYHANVLKALAAAAAKANGHRKAQLEWVHHSFSRGFMHRAETFMEGLLAVNFTWMLDGCDNMGRFDQVLGPLFDADLESGCIHLSQVRELLDELFCNFERLNGWNLQLGGYTAAGEDGVNALTHECLQACSRNHLRRPNVALRITRETPDEVLLEALKVLGHGSGRPALYNDDYYMESLLAMDLGLNEQDGREMSFGGCTETMIGGMSNVGSIEGSVKPRGINLAKALELTVFDGFDPVKGRQEGPHTGSLLDMPDFDMFMEALKGQIQYQTQAFVLRSRDELQKRFTAGDPKLHRTFFTRDCVKKRKSFEAGGARYNWAVVSYYGIANMIDGAAAIRKAVFQDTSITGEELMNALREDFEGHEDTMKALLSAPKFGNDNSFVDDIGEELLDYAWKELSRHETPRGGRYLAACIMLNQYQKAGQQVGATPDGRRKFEALVDSIGPMPGRDRKGPTAVLNSVSRLPLNLAPGTPVLNLRFNKTLFTSENSLRQLAFMIRTFFCQGGLQLQISVLDAEQLFEAFNNPDLYPELMVRIGGFSEYFNRLDQKLKKTIIQRTEHG